MLEICGVTVMSKTRARRRLPKDFHKKFSTSESNAQFVWSIVILVVFFSALSALAAVFFVNIHYNNEVVSANDQASSAQAQLKSEQSDVNFVIQHDDNQINCFQLSSSYDRNICNSHNQ